MPGVCYEMERVLRGLKFRCSRHLEDRAPEEVWPGITAVSVHLRPFAGRFGNLKRYELLVLCAVAKQLRSRTLFEFGTFDGLTTWHLAANCGPEARIWTLDLPLDHPARVRSEHDRTVGKIHGVAVGGQFAQTDEGRQITQLFGDSCDFDPQPYKEMIDFCFVDAGHSYEHVCRDTENALVMLKPGGVIFWHDYSRWWPGVQKCLDDLSGSLPLFCVAETALAVAQIPGA